MSPRLFIALPVPPPVRAVLSEAAVPLRKVLAGSDVRWQDPEKSHLTLVFLGDTDARAVPAVSRRVEEAARLSGPFRLATGRYGVFPHPDRPSVLWLGVTGDLRALAALQARVVGSVSPLAAAPPRSAFRPHLTLARLRRLEPADRRRLAALLASAPPQTAEWEARSVQLLESRLGPSGSAYTVVAEPPLRGG